jgi:hypothetical protein
MATDDETVVRVHVLGPFQDEHKLLRDKLDKIAIEQTKHATAYTYWRRVDTWTGFTVCLISAVLSTLIGSEGVLERDEALSSIQIVLSAVCFLIVSSVRFFGVTSRVQNHFSTVRAYSQMSAAVNLRLVRNHLTKADIVDMISDLEQGCAILDMYALDTSH